MITLAHLSDPHLSPMPTAAVSELCNKRSLGWFNWHRKRKNFHLRAVADLLVRDVHEQTADHVAVTGDLVNISLPGEFETARAWLETIGPGEHVSVVPGNHDAYVPLPFETSIGLWGDYMKSCGQGTAHAAQSDLFPYVRIVGHIALIGLSTAVPTPPTVAWGTLGQGQLAALGAALETLNSSDLYRVVLIHHPPLPGQNSRRKCLTDAAALAEVFKQQGVELVLHGHNHLDMHTTFETIHGTAHIFGVPSASGANDGHRPAAEYNLYRIGRNGAGWDCTVEIRGLNAAGQAFEARKELTANP